MAEKDKVRLIKRQYFGCPQHDAHIDNAALDGELEVGLQHHQRQKQHALRRNKEEKRFKPLVVFALTEEHPPHKPLGKGLQQEIACHQTREYADNNELLGDEGFNAQMPQVKEEERENAVHADGNIWKRISPVVSAISEVPSLRTRKKCFT